MVVIYVVIHDEVNNNKHILFTHATSRSNKNSLTHVREGKKRYKKKKKEIIYLYKTFSTSNNFDVYNLKFIYVQTVLKLKANHCYN